MAYVPSACGVALVDTWARSLPQCGSVRHIVPVHSPVTSLGRYLSLSSGEPCSAIVLKAPCDSPGNRVQVKLAVASISPTNM